MFQCVLLCLAAAASVARTNPDAGQASSLDSPANQHRLGHLKPFGAAGAAHLAVPTLPGFPTPEVFHREYVSKYTPLVMRGAMATFQAWTDDALLGLDLSGVSDSDTAVNVETLKKEDRQRGTQRMHFQQFLREYNRSELYMVGRVPGFMARDVPVPWPLQCAGLRDALVDCLMWFSSGGTSSVVHTDEVDNLNCLVAGRKSFVLVDPARHGDKVPIDRPDGAYSSVDVDAVDYGRYPGMHAAEFYHVHMSAGDCLYIPFQWIHQVRSYGRNIAINLWWDRSQIDSAPDGPSALPKGCLARPDAKASLDALRLQGVESVEHRDMLRKALAGRLGGLRVDAFFKEMSPNMETILEHMGAGFTVPLKEIFDILDKNGDGLVFPDDLKSLKSKDWKIVDRMFLHYFSLLDIFEKRSAANKDEL